MLRLHLSVMTRAPNCRELLLWPLQDDSVDITDQVRVAPFQSVNDLLKRGKRLTTISAGGGRRE